MLLWKGAYSIPFSIANVKLAEGVSKCLQNTNSAPYSLGERGGEWIGIKRRITKHACR